MKVVKKLFVLAAAFFMMVSIGITAEAASVKFSKKVYVVNQGKSITLRLKNSTKRPKITSGDKAISKKLGIKVLSNSRIRVKAKQAGHHYLNVSVGSQKDSCIVVVMPKKNPQIKRKSISAGTRVTYKGFSLTLPKVWKKYGYVTMSGKRSLTFCAKSSYRTGYYGHVFSVNWCSKKNWNKIKGNLPNSKYLKTKGNTVYYLSRPTDVQFNTESKTAQRHYAALDKTVTKVAASFKVK